MTFVIAKLPRTGLGNKLFVWANAYIFAKQNNLPLIVVGWIHFSFQNLKFWNKNKRIYYKYFKNTPNIWALLKYCITKVFNPQKIATQKEIKNTNISIYQFSELPHWSDFFKGIRENHAIINKAFFDMLHPNILKQYHNLDCPVIAVHIRMGDFRKLKENEDFKKVGGVRTPTNYFIDVINHLRNKTNSNLPVTVFSDGTDNELNEILSLSNTRRVNNEKDILDMLHISKADVIITSAGSTFSFWAAFFSKAIVFIHPFHFHSYIRPQNINLEYYEGPTPLDWNNIPELLQKNLDYLTQKYKDKQ